MSAKIDHTGEVYGDFIIIGRDEETSKKYGEAVGLCKCQKCGTIYSKVISKLRKGHQLKCRACGGYRSDLNEFIGKMFGMLEVLEYDQVKSEQAKRSIFKCRCHGTCGGNIVYKSATDLNANSKINSCGCLTASGCKYIPIPGKRFDNVVIKSINEEQTKIKSDPVFNCICIYGHEFAINKSQLIVSSKCPICGA